MKALVISLTGAIVVVGLGVHTPALAGPPRSPYGGIMHPTYSSMRQRQEQRGSPYRYRIFANQPAVESRRSFSYQPVPEVSFKAGQRVAVAGDGVKLMRGRDAIATLDKGQEVTILKVQGQWLGTSVTVDGQTKSGWVAVRNVHRLNETQSPKPDSGNSNAA
jgi:hypothetical protein